MKPGRESLDDPVLVASTLPRSEQPGDPSAVESGLAVAPPSLEEVRAWDSYSQSWPYAHFLLQFFPN